MFENLRNGILRNYVSYSSRCLCVLAQYEKSWTWAYFRWWHVILWARCEKWLLLLFLRDVVKPPIINSITLDNINLDDDNFHYFDSETINYVRIMVLYNKYMQRKISVNKK